MVCVSFSPYLLERVPEIHVECAFTFVLVRCVLHVPDLEKSGSGLNGLNLDASISSLGGGEALDSQLGNLQVKHGY